MRNRHSQADRSKTVFFLWLALCWQDMPGRSGHVRAEGVQGKHDTWGGHLCETCEVPYPWQLWKSVTPSALWAPASKCGQSGHHDSTVLWQREAGWLCCVWGTGLPAGHVGWDSTTWVLQTLPATEPICSTWFPWAYPLQLHPICSFLGIAGWRRTLPWRTDAAHGLFSSGHCRQPLGYPGN